ncbi:MAG: MFS transporter [Planctomycetes bacterium]|nr:MFS transporter [Planctomycetota bacterium]
MSTTAFGLTPPAVKSRLSVMMFLQYAIWGAWLPLLWPFLNNVRGMDGGEIGRIFAVGAVGAIVSPFIAGQVADRYFNTEKFLGISHILGGILVWQLATIETYSTFLAFSLLYSLIYSPTLSLTNSLAFHHLADRDRDFGKIRVWGTVGWIIVGISIGQWLLYSHTPSIGSDAEIEMAQYEGMADAFRLSALLGVVMGIFCFTLPATPPTPSEERNSSIEAINEVSKQPLLTLFLLAIPVSCIHQLYFVHAASFLGEFQGGEGAAKWLDSIFGVGGGGLMTIGQMSEILVLAIVPLIAKSISRKNLLAIGLFAYALRMLLFMNGEAWGITAVIFGVALHGLCFGCFIFVAFMIVDEETSPDVRASAQSLFNLVIIGIGIIVGSQVAGSLAEWAKADSGDIDYTRLFSAPMWASFACLAALLFFYPNSSPRRGDSTADHLT